MTKGQRRSLRQKSVGYLEWHEEAERRAKRGEHQLKCQDCGRWYWPLWPAEAALHRGSKP